MGFQLSIGFKYFSIEYSQLRQLSLTKKLGGTLSASIKMLSLSLPEFTSTLMVSLPSMALDAGLPRAAAIKHRSPEQERYREHRRECAVGCLGHEHADLLLGVKRIGHARVAVP
jgi:hypothetical protein